MPATRRVLPDVERLRFGPESDNYCQALRIALQHRGENAGYPQISSWSGRAFSTCWNQQHYAWDQHLSAPDPDAEGYLRDDFSTARAAIERLGYDCTVLANADCQSTQDQPADTPRDDFPYFGQACADAMTVADRAAIRSALCSGIDAGHPVLALFSLSPCRWAPEWSCSQATTRRGPRRSAGPSSRRMKHTVPTSRRRRVDNSGCQIGKNAQSPSYRSVASLLQNAISAQWRSRLPKTPSPGYKVRWACTRPGRWPIFMQAAAAWATFHEPM